MVLVMCLAATRTKDMEKLLSTNHYLINMNKQHLLLIVIRNLQKYFFPADLKLKDNRNQCLVLL